MNNYQNLYNIIKTIYIQKQEEKFTNYHSYIEIQTRVMEHYQEALKIFPEENILGIFIKAPLIMVLIQQIQMLILNVLLFLLLKIWLLIKNQ